MSSLGIRSTAPVQGPLWGAHAADWAELNAASSLPAWQAVAAATGIGHGTSTLDIACGSGEFCRLAAELGATVSGIDAAEGMIEVARRLAPDADLRLGPMEDLPWDDASFDVVTGFNAFQFAADRVAALAEARRVTHPAGFVAACTWAEPRLSDLMVIARAIRELLPPPAPGLPEPPVPALGEAGVLEGLARQAGLDPVESDEVEVPFEVPDQATLERALLAPGSVAAAIDHAGEEATRRAIVEGSAPFRRPDGSYRFENVFRYVICTRDADPEPSAGRG